MTIKATALAMSVCVVVLCLISWTVPGDPFFAIISSSNAANIARAVLAAAYAGLSVKSKFKYKLSRKFFLRASVVAAGFGAAGLLAYPMDYALYGVFDPLDFVFYIAAGSLIAMRAIEIKPGHRLVRLPRPRLPRLAERNPLVRLEQVE